MSDRKSYRPAGSAGVASLAKFRELQGKGVPSDEAVMQAAISSHPSNYALTEIDHNQSNNEMAFRALERGLIDAARNGKIISFGTTIFPKEQKSEGAPFWERPAMITIDGIEYAATLFSIMRPADGDEPDPIYPTRRIDECIGMLEEPDNTRRYIFADCVNNVPQINDSDFWWVFGPDGNGGVRETPFNQWVGLHHPDKRKELQTVLDEHTMADPRGWSSGSHRLKVDGRHLHVVGAEAPANQRPNFAQSQRITRAKREEDTLG